MTAPVSEQFIERKAGLRSVAEAGLRQAVSYRVELMTSVMDFLGLESQWQALLQAAGETGLSLNYRWLSEWWRCFEQKHPFLVLVFDSTNQLVAVAPFQTTCGASGVLTRGLRKLQFAGTEPDVYDWMKILVHPDENELMILASIVEKIWQARQHWDVIDLRFCKERLQLEYLQTQLIGLLKRYARFSGPAFKSGIVESMTIPYIELPDTVQAYQADCCKKSYRADLRRIRNHVQRDFGTSGVELAFPPPSEESAAWLDDFLACHKRYWSQKGQKTQFGRYPELARFYQRIYQAMAVPNPTGPQFGFSILKAQGQAMSYHIDILHQHGCMGYLACYNPEFKKYRPGILHIEALIEKTIQLGGKRFEFGRGDASYKHQWNIRQIALWDFLLFKNQWAWMLWQGDQHLKKMKSDVEAKIQTYRANWHERKQHA